jgi:hypothetical protein
MFYLQCIRDQEIQKIIKSGKQILITFGLLSIWVLWKCFIKYTVFKEIALLGFNDKFELTLLPLQTQLSPVWELNLDRSEWERRNFILNCYSSFFFFIRLSLLSKFVMAVYCVTEGFFLGDSLVAKVGLISWHIYEDLWFEVFPCLYDLRIDWINPSLF